MKGAYAPPSSLLREERRTWENGGNQTYNYCKVHQITNLDLYCGIVLSSSIPSHAGVPSFVFPLSNKNVQFSVIRFRWWWYVIKMLLIYVKYISTISEPRDIWFWPSCYTTFQFSCFIKSGRDWTGLSKWRYFWFFCFIEKTKMTKNFIRYILIYVIIQFNPY